MATPENTFIGAVHRHLPAELYRMKNHNQFNAGIPDVWYSGPAGDLWLEYKFIVIPKRDTTIIKVELSDLQKNWIRLRAAEGRRVGVVVGCKEGGVWFPGKDWEADTTAGEFRGLLMTRQQVALAIVNLIAGS